MCKHRTSYILRSDFVLWLSAPRTLFMIIFMLLLCVLRVGQNQQFALSGRLLYIGETVVYYFYDGFNLMMSSSIFLLGCSEIPKQFSWQNQSLIRSTRSAWLFSYIFQCLISVIFTISIMIVSVLLLSIPTLHLGTGWSDLQYIDQMQILESEGVISSFLVTGYTPLEGVLLCITPLFFFWFSMLLVILLFGLTQHPHLGLILCAFAVLSYACLIDVDGYMSIFAVFRFARLSGMELEQYGIRRFWHAIAIYTVADTALIGTMTYMVKKIDLGFAENEV